MSRMSKRPRKAAPKSNRRLSPEERLARNIAQENRTPEQSNRRRNAGHAKPLRPDAGETKQATADPVTDWTMALQGVFSGAGFAHRRVARRT